VAEAMTEGRRASNDPFAAEEGSKARIRRRRRIRVTWKTSSKENPVPQDALPIHSDPEIMSGTPVFVGTRVPVQTLMDYLEAGDPLDEFLEDFPSVSREQVVAVLELAKEMLLARASAA